MPHSGSLTKRRAYLAIPNSAPWWTGLCRNRPSRSSVWT